MTAGKSWGSDVPVSLPEKTDPETPVMVDMGGFGFTTKGLRHNMTHSDYEEIITNAFTPQGQQ